MDRFSHDLFKRNKERPRITAKKPRTAAKDFFGPWRTDVESPDKTGIEAWTKMQQRKPRTGFRKQKIDRWDIQKISHRCQAIEDLILFVQQSLNSVFITVPVPTTNPKPTPKQTPEKITEKIPKPENPTKEEKGEEKTTPQVSKVPEEISKPGENNLQNEKECVEDEAKSAQEEVNDVTEVVSEAGNCSEHEDDEISDETSSSNQEKMEPPAPIRLSYTQANIRLSRPYESSATIVKSPPQHTRTTEHVAITNGVVADTEHDKIHHANPTRSVTNNLQDNSDSGKSLVLLQRGKTSATKTVLCQPTINGTHDQPKPKLTQQEIISALKKATPYKNSGEPAVGNGEIDKGSLLLASLRARTENLAVNHRVGFNHAFPIGELLPAVEDKLLRQRASCLDGAEEGSADDVRWERDIPSITASQDTFFMLRAGTELLSCKDKREHMLGPPPFKASESRTPLHRARETSNKRLASSSSPNMVEMSSIQRDMRWSTPGALRTGLRSNMVCTPRQHSARRRRQYRPNIDALPSYVNY